MAPEAVTILVVSGFVLIVFGLVPGLFWGLVEGLAEGIQNFRDGISSGLPVPPPCPRESNRPRPTWLAGLGALVIVLTVLTYLSR